MLLSSWIIVMNYQCPAFISSWVFVNNIFLRTCSFYLVLNFISEVAHRIFLLFFPFYRICNIGYDAIFGPFMNVQFYLWLFFKLVPYLLFKNKLKWCLPVIPLVHAPSETVICSFQITITNWIPQAFINHFMCSLSSTRGIQNWVTHYQLALSSGIYSFYFLKCK
jgi:hypothetical protein